MASWAALRVMPVISVRVVSDSGIPFALIGGEPIWRQDEEDGGVAALEIGKAEIGPAEHGGHTRAVEETGAVSMPERTGRSARR